jgi:hypothetical protein
MNMRQISRLATAVTIVTTTSIILAPVALAHAGEEHTNPIESLLHNGWVSVAVTGLAIGLVAVIVWSRDLLKTGHERETADDE